MKSPFTIRHSQFAFTLIELLAVITIIGILAGIVLGIAGYAQRRSANARAAAEIASMMRALEAYRQDVGAYPPGNTSSNSTPVYNVIINPKYSANLRPSSFVSNTVLDPFGNQYRYLSPGANNRVTFDLWSLGPDGIHNTTDDITNWR